MFQLHRSNVSQWLIHSRYILVTWLKPSKGNCGFNWFQDQWLSIILVDQLYFSTHLMAQDFIWMLQSCQKLSPIYYVTKGLHTFPKSISLKVNIIVQVEFTLTHYNVQVQHRGIRGFMPFPRVLVWKWIL